MAKFKSFRSDERGAVAVLVAVVGIALILVAGGALDFGRAWYVRQSLQQTADAAVAAAAATALTEPGVDYVPTSQDKTRMENVAREFFVQNNFLRPSLARVTRITPNYVNTDQVTNADVDSVFMDVSADVPTFFLGIIRMNPLKVNITTGARRPRPAPVQMVIAADATGSMLQPLSTGVQKIEALKSSARSLVTTLLKSNNVRIGLVPFAGMIRFPNPDSYIKNKLLEAAPPPPPYKRPKREFTSLVNWLKVDPPPEISDCFLWSCTETDTTCYDDGVPYSCKGARDCSCGEWRERDVVWSGCMLNRPAPYNLTIDNPTNPKYVPSWSSAGCSFMPFITDLVDKSQRFGADDAEKYLHKKINALNPSAATSTYVPAGLIWAWNMLTAETTDSTTGGLRVLDPDYPLNAGFTPEEVAARGVRRTLVLISDGNNSAFSDASGTLQLIEKLKDADKKPTLRKVNEDMVAICKNMKSRGITIYVIALQISTDENRADGSNVTFKQRLEQCSSNNLNPGANTRESTDFFFDVADPVALQRAFDRIGQSLSYLAITK